jgi:peroxiredoxin
MNDGLRGANAPNAISRRSALRFTALAFVSAALLGSACTARDSKTGGAAITKVAIGQPAPPYAATSMSGDSVSLSALRNKVVLLNVWATWCQPCRTEIPDVQALHKQFADRGLSVIGISIDGDDSGTRISDFAREFGMSYPIWRDPDERVLSQFRVIGVPATFLIDKEGVLRWRMTGPIQHGDSSLVGAIEAALR